MAYAATQQPLQPYQAYQQQQHQAQYGSYAPQAGYASPQAAPYQQQQHYASPPQQYQNQYAAPPSQQQYAPQHHQYAAPSPAPPQYSPHAHAQQQQRPQEKASHSDKSGERRGSQQLQAPPLDHRPSDASASSASSGNKSVYAVAKERFGNPLAHNAEWAPTRQDAACMVLPTIDLTMRLKNRFAGRAAGTVFDEPAPSFSRRPTHSNFHPQPFQPFSCKSDGKGEIAGEGFKGTYPGNIMVAHDVSAADWFRFLEDIVVSSKLSGGQQIISNVAPITMHMGATGYFITKAIQKGMMRKKEPVVFETIETWQQRFFEPRGLDVFVRQGSERLTARSPGGDVPQNPSLMAASDNFYDGQSSSSDKHGKHKKDKHHHKKDKDHKMVLTVASLMR